MASGLLAEAAGRAGAGRAPTAGSRNRPVDDVRHTVEHAGWRFGHLEGAGIETRAELHDAVAEALVLPDWYGRNLDALADVLRDVDGRQLLLWDTWSVLARAEPAFFAEVVDCSVAPSSCSSAATAPRSASRSSTEPTVR